MYLVHKVIYHLLLLLAILTCQIIKDRRVQWNDDDHFDLKNTCRVWNTVLNKDSTTL